VVIDEGPGDLPLVSSTYDASQADTPAGVAAVDTFFRLAVSPLAQFIIALIVTALFTFLVLGDARAQIPGTLFAMVSFIALVVAVSLLGVLIYSKPYFCAGASRLRPADRQPEQPLKAAAPARHAQRPEL